MERCEQQDKLPKIKQLKRLTMKPQVNLVVINRRDAATGGIMNDDDAAHQKGQNPSQASGHFPCKLRD